GRVVGSRPAVGFGDGDPDLNMVVSEALDEEGDFLRRRDFIELAGAASAAAAFPRVAFAQQAAPLPRIAFLSSPLAPPSIAAFLQGLADLGYTEGKNVVIERFVTSGDHTDDAVTAATAVATKPDVIFA